MTSPPPRSPLAPVGVVSALVGAGAWVLALVRPWGDTGVTSDGSLSDATPVVVVVVLALAVVAALVASVATVRGTDRTPARWLVLRGGVVVVLAVAGAVLGRAVTNAQVQPDDGGLWALVCAVASAVAGVAVALSGVVRPGRRPTRLLTTVVASAVPVLLVVAAAVVATNWREHRIEGSFPDLFSESPGPATLRHVAWQRDFGDDALVAVLGGRVVVARDVTDGDDCRLQVRALDAGTAEAVWTLERPLRCDGPRLAGLDGNNSTVRLSLRGAAGAGPLTGRPLALYLGLEDGRPFTPSVTLARVRAWTEGFGLVVTDSELQGLDARTGVTLWARPLPTCADGPATLGLPPALPAGERTARSPYDGGAPNGTVPVTSVGNDVVVGVDCPGADGAVQRRVWMVDVTRDPSADRMVDLPAAAALVGDTGYRAAAATVPTTFLPWLDTVVAAVPVVAPDSPAANGAPVALVGLDRPSGEVLWTHTAAVVRTVDVSPTDGFVSVSAAVPDMPDSPLYGSTTVLGARTGDVLAQREEPSPVLASVALTGGRAEFTENEAVVVRNPVTGVGGDTFPTPKCRADLDLGDAPVLAGPGGVVMRCSAPAGTAAGFLGLVAQAE